MTGTQTATGWLLIGVVSFPLGGGWPLTSVAVAETPAPQGRLDHVRGAAASPDSLPEELSPHLNGPALHVPREILALLEQRKHALDRKEQALRTEAERLAVLRKEIEELVARHEQSVKSAEAARKAAAQQRAKAKAEARQASLAQLTKMYETMPPEEAAVRIEKMPRDLAVQLLRMLKGKTAGAILAQVTPAKAAKLTEELIAKP